MPISDLKTTFDLVTIEVVLSVAVSKDNRLLCHDGCKFLSRAVPSPHTFACDLFSVVLERHPDGKAKRYQDCVMAEATDA